MSVPPFLVNERPAITASTSKMSVKHANPLAMSVQGTHKSEPPDNTHQLERPRPKPTTNEPTQTKTTSVSDESSRFPMIYVVTLGVTDQAD